MNSTAYNDAREAAKRAKIRLKKHQRECTACCWAQQNGFQTNPECHRGRFLLAMYADKVNELAEAERDAATGFCPDC